MSRHTEAIYLDHMLAACDRIGRFLKDVTLPAFLANEEKQSAVIRQLEIIGEAAGRLSPSFRVSHPQLPWQRIKDLRNVLIHGYAEVDLLQVWDITQQNVPALAAGLRALTRGEPEWER
jgi:uncharacterized protein with HEPN domain